MIKNLLENIMNGIDVRQNLSQLRQEIKETNKKNELLDLIDDDSELINGMKQLLDSEDAKTRKNAALLMGDLEIDEFCDSLFKGYQAEDQMFVKSAYLNALKSFNYFAYLSDFKNRLAELAETTLTVENKKHVEEEMRALTELIVEVEGITTHTFGGFNEDYDCILLTNRLHTNVTEAQLVEISGCEARSFNAGVEVKTNHLFDILPIRTYSELLFTIKGMKNCEMDAIKAAATISSSDLLNVLKKAHSGTTPFYFRVEIKSKIPLDKKSIFAKKFSSELERLSSRQLLNSPTNYEFEIRLIENKIGNFNVLVKFNTIKDERFDYRVENISSSIKPVNAALLVALAKDYMIDNARVLDPFCGVGTMLIERQKIVKANTSYGIDILSDAINKAKINTEAAGQIIHYINRDFFDFTHEYVFDEIFTNMPFRIGRKTEEEIYELYRKFFDKAKEFLTQDGTIIMYSHNRDYVSQLTKENRFTIVKEFEIMDKEETFLFIIK